MVDVESLLARLQRGDPSAFEELVRTYGREMRAVTIRILMDEADADDAVQDAFLSAFQAVNDFEGQAELGTWLHRIAINAALMRLRRKGRSLETNLGGMMPDFLPAGAFAVRQPVLGEAADEPAIRRELKDLVHERIQQLPDGHRVPLLLRDVEGFDNDELAQALGVTPSTARVRVHRARQALRTLLVPHLSEFQ